MAVSLDIFSLPLLLFIYFLATMESNLDLRQQTIYKMVLMIVEVNNLTSLQRDFILLNLRYFYNLLKLLSIDYYTKAL